MSKHLFYVIILLSFSSTLSAGTIYVGTSDRNTADGSGSCIVRSDTSLEYDDDMVVFISDLHTNPDGYQPEKLRKVISDILAMRPLPRNVIALGDLAYLTGRPDEYAALKPVLAPIEEAGISLTLAMGNHDRRAEFGEAFPEHAAKSLLKDRYLYIVRTPYADFIVMDSLQEGEDTTTWITPGSINDELREWLERTLAEYRKPVFVCSHHGIRETGLTKLLAGTPCCRGYIHGHNHRWTKDWTEVWGGDCHVVRTLCLPSTGHWGDIGYVTVKLDSEKAVATLHESEFFFPTPAATPDEVPAQWKVFPEEYDGDVCTFTLK